MKVFLLHPDRDFDPEAEAVRFGGEVVRDLALDTIFSTMADGDRALHGVAAAVFRTAFANDAATIAHRQDVLEDCLANRDTVRSLRALAVEVKTLERKQHFWRSKEWPSSLLHNSIETMELFVAKLRLLRDTAITVEGRFRSKGFRDLFAMLKRELGEDYFAEISRHLAALRFRDGLLVSAGLGAGNHASGYVLRRPPADERNWFLRHLLPRRFGGLTCRIHPRDEAGWRIYSGMRDRGKALAAAALARSSDHISDFFQALLTELAFYVGAITLHERLTAIGVATARPEVVDGVVEEIGFHGLYDVCLALDTGHPPVGNDLSARDKPLIVVTGANQGGKSTFLRSLGQARAMMQAGLFVPAGDFRASLAGGLFTHFKREEDAALKSGKFDEELVRMNDVVAHIEPTALLLLNESLAATNEREASEIARQLTTALVESGVRVVYVTHLHDYARTMAAARLDGALFLRAERRADGIRTFRVVEGAPQATSWGIDLHRRIFGTDIGGDPADEEREEAST